MLITTISVFKLFSESFSALPLATLVGKKYFVLHGGLFSDDNVTLDDIRKLDRHKQRQPGQSGLMMEMLWTDPQTEPGRGPSKRGVGMQFGPDVTERFCEKNGLEAVIRSHEVRMAGYEEEHGGKCITGKAYFHRLSGQKRMLTDEHSLFSAQVLRHDGEQRCIHQHRSGLQAQVLAVRRCSPPQYPAYGKHILAPSVAQPSANVTLGLRPKLRHVFVDVSLLQGFRGKKSGRFGCPLHPNLVRS